LRLGGDGGAWLRPEAAAAVHAALARGEEIAAAIQPAAGAPFEKVYGADGYAAARGAAMQACG
jgi:hypothetical protein